MIETAVAKAIASAEIRPAGSHLTPEDQAFIERAIAAEISSERKRLAPAKLALGLLLLGFIIYMVAGYSLWDRPAARLSARAESLQTLQRLELTSNRARGTFDLTLSLDRIRVLDPTDPQITFSAPQERHRTQIAFVLPLSKGSCPSVARQLGLTVDAGCARRGFLRWPHGFAVSLPGAELHAASAVEDSSTQQAAKMLLRLEPHPETLGPKGIDIAMDAMGRGDTLVQINCESGKLTLEPAGRPSLRPMRCVPNLSPSMRLKIRIAFSPPQSDDSTLEGCYCPLVAESVRQPEITASGHSITLTGSNIPFLIGDNTLVRLGPTEQRFHATSSASDTILFKLGFEASLGTTFFDITSGAVTNAAIEGHNHVLRIFDRNKDLVLALGPPLMLLTLGWLYEGCRGLSSRRHFFAWRHHGSSVLRSADYS